MNNITLTPSALKHLQQSMEQSPEGTLGIRLGLRDAGCSGYAYTMDYAKQHNADDQIIKVDNVNIYIAADCCAALNGMEIDYVQRGVNSMLEFNNPNVVDQCGCGESFKFKQDPK